MVIIVNRSTIFDIPSRHRLGITTERSVIFENTQYQRCGMLRFSKLDCSSCNYFPTFYSSDIYIAVSWCELLSNNIVPKSKGTTVSPAPDRNMVIRHFRKTAFYCSYSVVVLGIVPISTRQDRGTSNIWHCSSLSSCLRRCYFFNRYNASEIMTNDNSVWDSNSKQQ